MIHQLLSIIQLVCFLLLCASTKAFTSRQAYSKSVVLQQPRQGRRKVPQQHPTPKDSFLTTTTLRIGNLLGNSSDKKNQQVPPLPRDVKDAVSKCRAAVQQALQDKCSRMDIEMPVGAKFGVEKSAGGSGKKKKSVLSSSDDGSKDGAPTRDMLEQSNRELARLFVEMFQPVGGENIAVVFPDMETADMAKKKWKGDYGAASRILAINRKKKKGSAGGKKKKGKAMGFAAKLAAEVDDDGPGGPFDLPDNIEVALFVAPGPKELVQVERICDKVGMGTLVVLLNARLSSISNFGSDEAKKLFLEEFQPVFALAAAPQQEAPGCLLYRSYPSPWVLARKPKVGPPKPILSQTVKPTKEECKEAYDSLELGDVEKGIENVLENVAGFFN